MADTGHINKPATRKLINYEDLRRHCAEGRQINQTVYRRTVDRRPRGHSENKHVPRTNVSCRSDKLMFPVYQTPAN